MTFYLGTHQVCWLERVAVPLFVSRRRLCHRRRLPRATCDWALDSGAFTELERGGWSIRAAQYVSEARRYRDEIGRLQWAPVMDWMCEPWIVAATGLSVAEHQRRTIESYLDLQALAPEMGWVPVLQGWEEREYYAHIEQYQRAGVDLFALPLVGLGSVCRRQHSATIVRLVQQLQPLKLHGFGVKTAGLAAVGDLLASADSLAWSAGARRQPPLPGCRHRNCANCLRWALRWRERVCAIDPAPRQLFLF